MATDGEFVLRLLEQVGTKVGTRNRKISRALDRHPPIGTNENLGLDPVSNGLLAGLRFPELAELRGETGLAAANRDGSLEGNKVRFIHEARDYTNSFVRVNNSVCVTEDKGACMVLPMSSKKTNVARLRAPQQRAKKTPPKAEGADGRTLAQRLELAMAYKSGQLGHSYMEKDLIVDANTAAGRTMDDPLISQQIIHAIRKGLVARSNFTPYLAEACGVRHLWLGNGLGDMLSK